MPAIPPRGQAPVPPAPSAATAWSSRPFAPPLGPPDSAVSRNRVSAARQRYRGLQRPYDDSTNSPSSVAASSRPVSTWLVPGDSFLSRLNAADPEGAIATLLPCCASRRWAGEMVDSRPFKDLDDLTARSDTIFAELDWPDVREAIDAHPRIGEKATGTGLEARWSRAEQSAAQGGNDELKQANVDYEDRFGHVFLICATGLDAQAILENARRRLANDDNAERVEVREELRKIVALRLAKLGDW
ncbi:2-oxo-4-hydroxy-4-carboxy-5-ureidoimidazoline decarboxylase [Actinokineospora sp. HUAS TT18]|uniref:2-oxo-4-hydroxy-4-carboxy-5-ureidoimidazoline decarboxylase n=1 Tax=Actinokineospora sp. HUAS TT18 TaxID=3447451 RepID=UPI003F51C470